jgi:hypothetical protein
VGPPGPVWTGEENLAPRWDSIPDRPARSSVAIQTELPVGEMEVTHSFGVNEFLPVFPNLYVSVLVKYGIMKGKHNTVVLLQLS